MRKVDADPICPHCRQAMRAFAGRALEVEWSDGIKMVGVRTVIAVMCPNCEKLLGFFTPPR